MHVRHEVFGGLFDGRYVLVDDPEEGAVYELTLDDGEWPTSDAPMAAVRGQRLGGIPDDVTVHHYILTSGMLRLLRDLLMEA